MFKPAARTWATAASQSFGAVCSVSGSSGIQQAPRANTGTSLTTSWKPSLRRSTSMLRKPTWPTARVCGGVPAGTPWGTSFSVASYKAGSPWVCGHHRSACGTSTVARHRPSSAGQASASTLRPWRVRHTRTDCAAAAPASKPTASTRRPCSPWREACRSRCTGRSGADASSQMARHGPTVAACGDQPGVRPSKVVRHQRSCGWATMGARQRGRCRRCFRASASGSKTMRSSLPWGRRRPARFRVWARNMLVEDSSGSPFRLTWASVARPSRPKVQSRAGSGASKTRR